MSRGGLARGVEMKNPIAPVQLPLQLPSQTLLNHELLERTGIASVACFFESLAAAAGMKKPALGPVG